MEKDTEMTNLFIKVENINYKRDYLASITLKE